MKKSVGLLVVLAVTSCAYYVQVRSDKVANFAFQADAPIYVYQGNQASVADQNLTASLVNAMRARGLVVANSIDNAAMVMTIGTTTKTILRTGETLYPTQPYAFAPLRHYPYWYNDMRYRSVPWVETVEEQVLHIRLFDRAEFQAGIERPLWEASANASPELLQKNATAIIDALLSKVGQQTDSYLQLNP